VFLLSGSIQLCSKTEMPMPVHMFWSTVGNYEVEIDLLAGSPMALAPAPLMSGSIPGCFLTTTLKEATSA
jgi:hypothetical protein